MGQAMWIFVFLVLLHVSICRTQKNCGDRLPENNFLTNIDKLLNLSHVKIASGMMLRKKENSTIQVANNDSMCNNSLVENVGLRIRRMMETHVIEFDLSSVVRKGKRNFCDILCG
jgi:hypothetical protein